MADTPLCSLTITTRESQPLAAGVVAEAADLLGLDVSERTRLRTLVTEVVDSIVADSFGGQEGIDLTLTVERTPGGFTVTIRDRGAPTGFGSGTYPPRIADLVRLGFADDLKIVHEGLAGNRTQISKHLHYALVTEDEDFGAGAAVVEDIELDAEGQLLVDVRPMTVDDVVGVARLFYRTYGYSATYAGLVYEPARLAEYVAAGRHLATVAVTSSGRIVAHLASEVESPVAITGRIGLLAVEPAFRQHGLAMRVGFAHLQRLIEHGFVGQFSEAVTLHTGSQRAALKSGGHEVGLILAAQSSELDFRGFEANAERRKSVMLFYGGFGATPERTIYAPPIYNDVITRIVSEAALPREVVSGWEKGPKDLPAKSNFRLDVHHESNVAIIQVASYGADFVAALQDRVAQLRLNRFDLILVSFPLNNPGTGYFAAGLHELGLSFCGLYPEYDDGDVLMLQSLNNVEIVADDIQAASPLGEYLRDVVLGDYEQAAALSARRRRSRTHMARIYEALQ